jgi:hypothetical protein
VLVTIPVLEETLGVKSVSLKPISKGVNNCRGNGSLSGCRVAPSIEGLCPNVVKYNINSLLKSLLRENLIDGITEVSPSDMAAFLGSSEVFDELVELVARQHDLCHVEADAELGLGDEARAKLVEIAEELSDTGTLLFANGSNTSNNVFNII